MVADVISYIRPGTDIFGMGLNTDPIPVDFNKIYKARSDV